MGFLNLLTVKLRRLPKEQKRSKFIRVYLNEAEYAEIADLSKRTGLTLSDFSRRILLGAEVKTMEGYDAVMGMLPFNADIKKIGGLLKLAISEHRDESYLFTVAHNLDKILVCLREKILAIKT